MSLLLLIAGGVLFWAWRSRQLKALRYGDVAAAATGIAAIEMLAKGNIAATLILLAGLGGWIAWRRLAPAGEAMSPREARDLLSLPAGADETAIRTAHRRLIARVHPDTGGSEELARRVNTARDTLLAVNRSRRHASPS